MQNEEGNTDIAFKTTGCSWLSPVSERVGVPLDQVQLSDQHIELLMTTLLNLGL